MKINSTIIIAILLISCSNKQKLINKDISFELINSEVHYVAIDSNLLVNNENKSYEDLKSYTGDERKKAYNLLTFKLINNSDKKYLFILNKESIGFLGNSTGFQKNFSNDKTSNFTSVCFLIDNKEMFNDNLEISDQDYNLFKDETNKIYLDKYYEMSERVEKDNYEDYASKTMKDYGVNYNRDSFVIYPGEYKIFKKKLFLPIYEEKDRNYNLMFEAIYIPPQNHYAFSLGISQKKDIVWKSLLDYQRKEIKDNGYEIFDGVLVSNKVPLKMIK